MKRISLLWEALRSIRVNPDKGTVEIRGQRFLLVPASFISAIEDRLIQDFGREIAATFLYEVGKTAGRSYVEMAKRLGFKTETSEDVRRILEKLGTLGGWARVELVKADMKARRAIIRWWNGVSVRDRKSEAPVCHIGRGLMAGGAEVIFGTGCEAIERRCEAMGHEFCEVVVGESEAVMNYVNEL